MGGLFIGVGTLISREIPFDTTQFLIYEFLKHKDYGKKEDTSMVQHMIHGAIAGGIAAYITTPIDVAKTRMMTQYSSDKLKYRSMPQTLSKIYNNEGFSALWTGWKTRVMFTTVGGMMFFGTFELISPILLGHDS
jgi:solute carrier family 25 S-adenosylmethionine transporter 26